MRAKKLKPATAVKGRTNHDPLPSKEEAQKLFVASLPKAKDGSNSLRTNDFIYATNILLDNGRPFTIQDLIALTRGASDILDTATIQNLYQRWTKKLVELKKLRPLPTCYSDELFAVV